MPKRSKNKVKYDESWRDNVRNKLNTILESKELSDKLEDLIYEQNIDILIKYSEDIGYGIFKRKYMYKLQMLITNLDPKSYIKNINLLPKVKKGSISLEKLITMTPEELYPEKWEKIKKKQEEEEKFLYENKRKATSNRIKCFSCGKKEVSTTEQQTRSADEPMTIFYECLNCGKRWRS
jgi:DNA-directed RNA polymerase subunit M/transcription elongation factor TFIIS